MSRKLIDEMRRRFGTADRPTRNGGKSMNVVDLKQARKAGLDAVFAGWSSGVFICESIDTDARLYLESLGLIVDADGDGPESDPPGDDDTDSTTLDQRIAEALGMTAFDDAGDDDDDGETERVTDADFAKVLGV